MIPKQHVCIIKGNMNSKIDKEGSKASTYHDHTNRNGQYLVELQGEYIMMNMTTN